MIDCTALEQLGFSEYHLDYGDDYQSEPNVISFEKYTDAGCMEFVLEDQKLYLWSGLGLGESYGFEVEVNDAGHLKTLLKLLGCQ